MNGCRDGVVMFSFVYSMLPSLHCLDIARVAPCIHIRPGNEAGWRLASYASYQAELLNDVIEPVTFAQHGTASMGLANNHLHSKNKVFSTQ